MPNTKHHHHHHHQDVLKSQLTAVGKDLEQSDKMRKNYENEVKSLYSPLDLNLPLHCQSRYNA